MTIRRRITLLFLGIVSSLLIVFCFVIYLQSEYYREQEFRTRLRAEALTAADILFGKEEISPALFKLLDKNKMTVLPQEEIVIYDEYNKIVHETGIDSLEIKPSVLQKIRTEKEVFFKQGNREILGLIFKNVNHTNLVVIAAGYDQYGLSEQRNLGLMLLLGCLIMIIIVSGTGWFFAGRSLKPIQRVIRQVDKISASQLSRRLDQGDNSDEIAQLSLQFNQMLDRLEKSFKLQRSFVSHASHELRTPLTAITGQIQVSLLAEDNQEELKLMIQSVLEDVQQLNKLTNNLLEMATVEADENNFQYSLVNLADVLWQIRSNLLKKNPSDDIIIELNDSTFNLPEMQANESLIYLALLNVVENGLKFSKDRSVVVELFAELNQLKINVQNFGVPIPSNELQEIFEPFKRGNNTQNVKGHGVGLSLVDRIVTLHKGNINVESSEERGTIFSIKFPL
jgi:signal transduction histidine kinase